MNIQNLGSKESVGFKYIDGIYAQFFLKVGFESNWKATESRWFQIRSRNKVPNNHFVKSVQKQPYADVLENRCS